MPVSFPVNQLSPLPFPVRLVSVGQKGKRECYPNVAHFQGSVEDTVSIDDHLNLEILLGPEREFALSEVATVSKFFAIPYLSHPLLEIIYITFIQYSCVAPVMKVVVNVIYRNCIGAGFELQNDIGISASVAVVTNCGGHWNHRGACKQNIKLRCYQNFNRHYHLPSYIWQLQPGSYCTDLRKYVIYLRKALLEMGIVPDHCWAVYWLLIEILFFISRPAKVFTLEMFLFEDGVAATRSSSLNIDYIIIEIIHWSKEYFILGSLYNAQSPIVGVEKVQIRTNAGWLAEVFVRRWRQSWKDKTSFSPRIALFVSVSQILPNWHRETSEVRSDKDVPTMSKS